MCLAMRTSRLDYAALPEAVSIVGLYRAGEKMRVIREASGFSKTKIRKLLVACGVDMRSIGRPGLGPPKKLTPIVILAELPRAVSRDPCPNCGVRGDVGCIHRPVGVWG